MSTLVQVASGLALEGSYYMKYVIKTFRVSKGNVTIHNVVRDVKEGRGKYLVSVI